MHVCGSYLVVTLRVCGRCVAYGDDAILQQVVCVCVCVCTFTNMWVVHGCLVIHAEGLDQTVHKQQGLCHAAKGCDSNSQLAECGNNTQSAMRV